MTLVDRIWRIRSWLAPLVRDVPDSSSYIMQLDRIAHELAVADMAKDQRKP